MKSLKYILIFSFLFTYANGVQLVPMAKKDIKYKQKISSSDIYYVEASKKFSCEKYLIPSLLTQNLYYAKRYIIKNRPICDKDAVYKKANIVKFRFGGLIIEKEGELVRETDEYIKIKNSDGKITKIYKDGRN